MSDDFQAVSDWQYARRLDTLRSVDDLVEALIDTLEATGQLNNTFIAYTCKFDAIPTPFLIWASSRCLFPHNGALLHCTKQPTMASTTGSLACSKTSVLLTKWTSESLVSFVDHSSLAT